MILLYHLVFPDDTPPGTWNAGKVMRLKAFQRQLLWIRQHYSLVSLTDYIYGIQNGARGVKKNIALTFDDGYRKTLDLVSPFLEKEEIPATFFVTTSHLSDGQLLWFVYFNAVSFEGVYSELLINGKRYVLNTEKGCFSAWRKLIDLARESGDAIGFFKEFAEKYPLPQKVVDFYIGFSEEQIAGFGGHSVLSLGGHTHSHPYLDHLSKDAQLAEISKNKRILEDISGEKIIHFAYTGGVYNRDSIMAVQDVGFSAAFAIQPKGLTRESLFEMPREDIYSTSLLKLQLKLWGLGRLIRRIKGWF